MEAACAWDSGTCSFWLSNGRGLEFLWILGRILYDWGRNAGRVEI